MDTSERRSTRRFKLHVAVRFHRQNQPSEVETRVTSVNVSTGGVYFLTKLAVFVGEALEVLVEIPARVTGQKACRRLFTGRVAHIECRRLPQGYSGVGVHFLYYVAECCTGLASLSVVADPGLN